MQKKMDLLCISLLLLCNYCYVTAVSCHSCSCTIKYLDKSAQPFSMLPVGQK